MVDTDSPVFRRRIGAPATSHASLRRRRISPACRTSSCYRPAVTKTLPTWAFGVLSVVGVVLLGSMLLSWVDFGGGTSGLGLAWSSNHWLFLVPVAGGGVLAAAATRSPSTRLAAIVAGTLIVGYVLFDVATSMIHSGLDTWLILGGAGAMLAGASKERAAWRTLGGIAVLAGFIAPWSDMSMFHLLRLTGFGNGVGILWIIPLAALVGVISGGNKVTGGKLAAGAGVAIYGSLLWVIGSFAYQIFGFGAWAALGASTVALAIGVLAREPVTRVTAAPSVAA